MSLRTLVSIVAAALAVAALATTALGAPDAKALTGVWAGKTHQALPPLGEGDDFVEWSQHIVVRAHEGRLTYVGGNVRYVCPDPSNPRAGDIQLNLQWPLGRGPRLSPGGGFSLNIVETTNVLTGRNVRIFAPVHLSGILGAGSAGGRFDLGKGDCSGKGSWRCRPRARRSGS